MSVDQEMVVKDTKEKIAETGAKVRSAFGEIGKKIGAITQKGLDAAKIGTNKATQMANDSALLAKLHFTLNSLRSDRESIFTEIGKKFWQSNSEGVLTKRVMDHFKNELDELSRLEVKIAEVEKEIQATNII